MSATTKIEWADSTWNPMSGCTKVSEGCRNCYAETIAERFKGSKAYPNGFGVTLFPDRLDQPLRWRKPRRVFVCSMGDLFHHEVPSDFLDQVFAVILANAVLEGPTHQFMILTKRPARMKHYLNGMAPAILLKRWAERADGWIHVGDGSSYFSECVEGLTACDWGPDGKLKPGADYNPSAYKYLDRVWPLPNVWLGVSVEDQAAADKRIPLLLKVPAAVRFVSCEPLLGAVDLEPWLTDQCEGCDDDGMGARGGNCPSGHCPLDHHETENRKVDWVIAGGESGPGSRPMHPDWARSLRDQCAEAGVPYFFKQFGDWAPEADHPNPNRHPKDIRTLGELRDGPDIFDNTLVNMVRVGKKVAGCELDGRKHQEWPETGGQS